ncbi:hypothetical protein P261_00579 [Lachnospiraceae bacterium TWA4]|nr:hypothetical protein P261_00579 [Lachnospiraceae bacterium TWA4]
MVLRMLEIFYDLPYRTLLDSMVDESNLPLLEIFITQFLNKVEKTLLRRMALDYHPIQEVSSFVRGRIQFQKPAIFRHQFSIEYDDYHPDCIENRLIKTTLLFLVRKTMNDKNLRKIRQLLTQFEYVKTTKDFNTYRDKRILPHYQEVLRWCQLLLNDKSFSVFSGEEVSTALLFPMNQLFESYMEKRIKEKLPKECQLFVQDERYTLFDNPPEFQLRPDFVVYNTKTEETYILDTKWKLLSKKKKHYGISPSDMYQMCAYIDRYQAKKAILLYPETEEKIESFSYDDKVDVMFVTL